MSKIASRSFQVTLYVTAALLVAAAAIALMLELDRPSPSRLPYLQFELDIFKVVLAGFVVSMLGILIPAVASEARQRFEQRKDSRAAYSKAKTGIDYLKLRLAASSLAEAATVLQEAHFNKHQAELFDDFAAWIEQRYGAAMTPLQWDEMMYRRLFRARRALEANAGIWDRCDAAARVRLLDAALPTEPEIPVDDL